MRAQAVIGASFGDEGKGYWVDAKVALAQAQGLFPWVVRHNSGAQAGHTVQMPDGRRHVFHHVGSGTFLGAPTFLGAKVAVHPMLFFKEMESLAALGVARPRVLVDARALVTTPYDVMINQAIETARGAARHGSCGVGFNETVERSLQDAHRITVADLTDESRLRARLDTLRRDHVPQRLAALGLPADAIETWRWHEGVLDRFVADAQAFAAFVEVTDPTVLRQADHVIFEGAQGLRLDQELGIFPHLTRSHTGVPALLDIAEEAGLEEVEITYATRAYLTRHGAGPLPEELESPPAPGFADPTNVPNPHQGQLRFALLDPETLADFIARDQARATGRSVTLTQALSVNCLDQMGPTTAWRDGTVVATPTMARLLGERLGIAKVNEGWGPARAHARFAE